VEDFRGGRGQYDGLRDLEELWKGPE